MTPAAHPLELARPEVAQLVQAVVDAMAVPAALCLGQRLVGGNPALQRLAGRSAGQLAGLEVAQLLCDDAPTRQALQGALALCQAQGREPPALAARLCRPDGGQRPVELCLRPLALPLADGHGAGHAAVLTCTDLSDLEHVHTGLAALDAMLRQVVDGAPLATFVLDRNHRVTHWNAACERLTGHAATDRVGRNDAWRAFYPEPHRLLADLMVDGSPAHEVAAQYQGAARHSALIAGALEAEAFFPHLGPHGAWLYFTAAPLRGADGQVIGAIETLQDVSLRHQAEQALRHHQSMLEQQVQDRTAELQARLAELQNTNLQLGEAQNQLLERDKMASLGQLAAGVAHEINNPVGFVTSNLNSLRDYSRGLLALVTAAEHALAHPGDAAALAAVQQCRQQVELDYLREDLPVLLDECADGLGRVKKIVQDLKDFSRVDQDEWQQADLNNGLESSLNMLRHEVRYKAEVVRRLAPLPPVTCLPAQLNQVFMNFIVNAVHAIDERGTITLSSGHVGAWAWVQVGDSGCGMSAEVQRRIFEPFYTTKAVGQGTGLGLSLSFSIVQKHGGEIQVRSAPGEGTRMRVWVPVGGPNTLPAGEEAPPPWEDEALA